MPSETFGKLFEMFLALISIQTLGTYLGQALGPTLGGGFSGLIGGFVSSTAITVEVARNSRQRADDAGLRVEFVRFLTANLAMLSAAFFVTLLGTEVWSTHVWILYAAPIALNAWTIYRETRLSLAAPDGHPSVSTNLSANLKLAFLLAVFSTSFFYVRKWFGGASLVGITFVTSFFEVHAVTIANATLAGSGAVTTREFANLVVLSIAASILSKLFIVASAGSARFVKLVGRWLGKLFAASALGWIAFAIASS
jgi:uncharacterized membrane protein (DUF4010 family)